MVKKNRLPSVANSGRLEGREGIVEAHEEPGCPAGRGHRPTHLDGRRRLYGHPVPAGLPRRGARWACRGPEEWKEEKRGLAVVEKVRARTIGPGLGGER
jgi:hypothetical protein